MRGFELSPPLRVWLETILTLHPDAPGPTLPGPPTNPEELAFYNTMLVPLAQIKAEVVASVPPPAPVAQPQPWDYGMSTP